MPNWCDNILIVTGPDSELKRFSLETTGQGELDFEMILPTPPDTTGSRNEGWWDWRVSAAGWGTKWAADIHDINHSKEKIVFSFHSAWSPPEGIVRQLGAMYPGLRFHLLFAEAGSGFAGELDVQGTEVLAACCHEGEPAAAFALKHLGQDWAGWCSEDE